MLSESKITVEESPPRQRVLRKRTTRKSQDISKDEEQVQMIDFNSDLKLLTATATTQSSARGTTAPKNPTMKVVNIGESKPNRKKSILMPSKNSSVSVKQSPVAMNNSST